MKRMSEVFELPVAVGGGMFDKDTIYNSDGNGEWVATFADDEQTQHAARAINHVDALADALEMMTDMYCAGNLPNKATLDASSALAAYRGDK